jgi:hypothetical protein
MKIKTMKRLAASIILPFLIAYCGAAAGDKPAGDTEATASPGKILNKGVKRKTTLKCKKGTGLNYDNFGHGFMLNYCTTCHSSQVADLDRANAPIEINLDSASDVQIWRARILKVVLASTVETDVPIPGEDPPVTGAPIPTKEPARATMPPDGSLGEPDRAMFLEWLNCGAP